jgi:hypothetical protein
MSAICPGPSGPDRCARWSAPTRRTGQRRMPASRPARLRSRGEPVEQRATLPHCARDAECSRLLLLRGSSVTPLIAAWTDRTSEWVLSAWG